MYLRVSTDRLTVVGFPKPLDVFMDFDAQSVDAMIERLTILRNQMLGFTAIAVGNHDERRRAKSDALRPGFCGLSGFLHCLLATLCTQTRWRERAEKRRGGRIIEVKEALASVAGVSSDDFRLHGTRKRRGISLIGESAMDFGWARSAHNGDGVGARRNQLCDPANKKIAARLHFRCADFLHSGKNGRHEMRARMTAREIGPRQSRHCAVSINCLTTLKELLTTLQPVAACWHADATRCSWP